MDWVEIVGLTSPVEVDGTELSADDLNGLRGHLQLKDDDESNVLVETTGGFKVSLPIGNLRLCDAVPPEDGGFDLAWPAEDELFTTTGDVFGQIAAEALMDKGYCVIDMFLGAQQRVAAMEEAAKLTEFEAILQEVEAGYLGHNNSTKVVSLELRDVDHTPLGSIQTLDQQLTNLGMMLIPAMAGQLGFECWGRGSALVRVPRLAGDALPPKMPETPTPNELSKVSNYLQWSSERTVSMLYVIQTEEGGRAELFKRERAGGLEPEQEQHSVESLIASLPLTSGRLLLFRHDLMSYAYLPKGSGSLALQAWLLGAAQTTEHTGLVPYAESLARPLIDDGFSAKGPELRHSECAHVMSTACDLPTAVNTDEWWNMAIAGTDLHVWFPFSRFHMDLYYHDDMAVAEKTGKTYMGHCTVMTPEQLMQFDPVLFGFGDDYETLVSPAQQVMLVQGARALHEMGFKKLEEVRGRKVAVAVGQAVDEIGYVRNFQNPEWPLAKDEAICCSRISYQFGLTGPTSSHDTACSSAIMALSTVHHLMRSRAVIDGRVVQLQSDADTPKEGLIGSHSIYLSHEAFVGESAGHMLGHHHRTYFLDSTADGFTRGEATCMMGIMWRSAEQLAAERLCVLAGTALNEDGRSATLTAPNGPAQQEVARTSMRDAGIEPGEVLVHDCHGTGTSLGDPIEVGALRAVFGKKRTGWPFAIGGVKSNTGHTEAAAGLVGVYKAIMTLNFQSIAPNLHLKTLNPNIDHAGFPVVFPYDMCDIGLNTCYASVSAFGFGGANSRTDLWGNASRGLHKIEKHMVMDDKAFVAEIARRIGDETGYEAER